MPEDEVAPAGFEIGPGYEQEWPDDDRQTTEVLLNLIRAGESVRALVDAFVQRWGIPSAIGMNVMEVLRGEGGPLIPSVIADRTLTSRPALSGVLTTLEKRGFIERRPDEADRRRILVELTPSGRSALEELFPALHQEEVRWTAGLSDRQKASLLRELVRLQASIASASGEDEV